MGHSVFPETVKTTEKENESNQLKYSSYFHTTLQRNFCSFYFTKPIPNIPRLQSGSSYSNRLPSANRLNFYKHVQPASKNNLTSDEKNLKPNGRLNNNKFLQSNLIIERSKKMRRLATTYHVKTIELYK